MVIILPGASKNNALKKAKKICKAINATLFLKKDTREYGTFSLSVSIGVSSYRKNDTAATVTERVDKAL